jgi:hypothetical protein
VDEAMQRAHRQRAAALRDDVERTRGVADDLDRLADRVEGRLEAVVTLLVPATWAGRAADEARGQARDASEGLVVAAGRLRRLAASVREEAAAAQARLDLLGHGAVGAPPGPDRAGPA